MEIIIKIIECSEPVNMLPGETLFAIKNNLTGKFVEWVSKTGRVTYRKNPFKANYFITSTHAGAWMKAVKINTSEFSVVGFEKVLSDSERATRELDDFIDYGILPE